MILPSPARAREYTLKSPTTRSSHPFGPPPHPRPLVYRPPPLSLFLAPRDRHKPQPTALLPMSTNEDEPRDAAIAVGINLQHSLSSKL